jgi:hypothetical protein
MLKRDVKVGSVYAVKVSGLLRPVRLDREAGALGGWYATNLSTGRPVRIHSAQKLRYELEANVGVACSSDAKWRRKREVKQQ